ncbi:MAG TPA: UDP-2,3-diacylglucosamine diphosphatase [Sulfurovum sp.]|nr:UDP-2,3-diacylglucosamine diphosphatase [Sulfurovum sp.]
MLQNIEEGAIFIADSHYPNHGNEFLELLKKINNKELEVSQLFLMGDNFDLLVGGLRRSYIPNAEAIEILKAISKNIQIFYFEGNHDFQLKKIFKNINIYTIGEHPQYMEFKKKRVGLSHGDRFAVGLGHNILNHILRNSLFLAMISFFEEVIIANKTKQLKTKNICNSIEGFEQKTKDISVNYKDVDLIIEGHYHQAKIIGNYISLPSLACQKQVAIARNGEIVFVDIDNL